LIIIDYNAIAISNIVTQKLAIEEDLIRHMILNSIRMYRKRYHREYGEIVIANDGQKNWRYQYFPHYKHKRKQSREQDQIDWSNVFEIINKVYEELQQHFPYKTIKVDQCEADDVIAVLVERTQEFGQHEPVMIVSSDKDFAQLQRYSNVAQYSPTLKKLIKIDNPRLELQKLILRGDKDDGVPNVLSADDIFTQQGIRQTPLRNNALEQLIKDPHALGEQVYRNYLRNKKLIDLSETPDPVKQKILNTFDEQNKEYEKRGKVLNYLIQNRCRRLIEDIGDFI